MTPVATEPQPEQFGRYRLVQKLAQGGMAEIFLALQAADGAPAVPVVIKRVLPELCEEDDFALMFLDEARIAARIDHPNVVRIFDLGEVGGQYYLAMEYLPAEDQASVIREARRKGLPVPPEYAAEVVLGAAEALAFAHAMKDAQGQPMQLVHRDVSPSNILVTWRGEVKLVDFGIARAESNVVKTELGLVKGKIQYLSPEQCKGLRADRRSDLFALGIVLYELLTSSRLFLRDSAFGTIEAILKGQIPPLERERPDAPEALVRVARRALALDPNDRYQTGADLGADLASYLAGTTWVRGRHSVEFLTSIFGEERKQERLSVAGPAGAAPAAEVDPFPTTGVELRLPLPDEARTQVHGPARPRRPARRALVAVALAAAGAGLGALALGGAPPATGPLPPEPQAKVPAAVPPQPAPQAPAPLPSPRPAAVAVEPPPAEVPGRLKLVGLPRGAKVSLDGAAVASPVGEQALAAGSHTVAIEARGFLRFTREVRVAAGETAVLKVAMKKRRR